MRLYYQKTELTRHATLRFPCTYRRILKIKKDSFKTIKVFQKVLTHKYKKFLLKIGHLSVFETSPEIDFFISSLVWL